MNQSDVYRLESVTINVEAIWDFHLHHDAICFSPNILQVYLLYYNLFAVQLTFVCKFCGKEIIALWKSPDMESCKNLDKYVRKWALFIFYKISQHYAIKQ